MKRFMDLVIAIPGIVVASPVIAVAAVAVKLDTKGSVFYRDPHICTACRYRADDMLWRCPHCHEWNTFVEERLGPGPAGGR